MAIAGCGSMSVVARMIVSSSVEAPPSSCFITFFPTIIKVVSLEGREKDSPNIVARLQEEQQRQQ
eukprot:scaffold4985_cov109-Cylindrotheca_fusiformis.AAC.2